MIDELFLSQADSRPMYAQIFDQVKLKILAGDWPQGRPLPSIRELAAATKVSVITVKRAYADLEEAGLIVTQPGRGSFVAAQGDDSESLDSKLSRRLDALVQVAKEQSLDDETLINYLRIALNRHKQDGGKK